MHRRSGRVSGARVRAGGLRRPLRWRSRGCVHPAIPLYASALARRREAPLDGRPAWFLSPEDLGTFKMLFFRTKDLLDVERLVAFAGKEFDRAYVRTWLVDLVGAGDERIARWDRLLADVDAAAP